MLIGKLAGAVFGGLFIAATSAGTWKAYSYSYETAQLHAVKAAEQAASAGQASNAGTKSDRLVVAQTRTVAVEPILAPSEAVPQIAAAPQGNSETATYAVAALTSTDVELPKPRLEPRKSTAAEIAREKQQAAREKAKRAEKQKLLLDDAQIAALKTRLKLTPTQQEFWPAVEVTLRDVVRAHARNGHGARAAPRIDVNSAEVQQLISAAVPLIMRLSEEQKREVRQLARIMGLETVAQQI